MTWSYNGLGLRSVYYFSLPSPYCKSVYLQQRLTYGISFWTDPPTKHKKNISDGDQSTVKTVEHGYSGDSNSHNIQFDEHDDFDAKSCDGSDRSDVRYSLSDEVMDPFDATEEKSAEHYNRNGPVAIHDTVSSNKMHVFKRMHFIKSKDAHHCIKRVMDLFLLTRLMILDLNHGIFEFFLRKPKLQRSLSMFSDVFCD